MRATINFLARRSHYSLPVKKFTDQPNGPISVVIFKLLALLARGFGLHTCPQQAWVSFHCTVRVFLGLPDNLMIYSGMALGYQDGAAPINSWRSPRAPLDANASFEGFDS